MALSLQRLGIDVPGGLGQAPPSTPTAAAAAGRARMPVSSSTVDALPRPQPPAGPAAAGPPPPFSLRMDRCTQVLNVVGKTLVSLSTLRESPGSLSLAVRASPAAMVLLYALVLACQQMRPQFYLRHRWAAALPDVRCRRACRRAAALRWPLSLEARLAELGTSQTHAAPCSLPPLTLLLRHVRSLARSAPAGRACS